MYISKELLSIIKNSIKEADRGLFFLADYEKQALNVIKKLDRLGYKVVPKNPSDEMVAEGKDCISYGLTDPKKLVRQIYKRMIDAL